ncbi:LytR/AlgR family response regulator transcription factor [Runella slithyformis]|uniref:Two component transcriptional regulator, LytTR family n=1 Tax=Runella slithyformis (strain ATCC 29530 / DSM 19594 / LMG 11500 / NCIMB 11436 / LSU 4) TaxID=761193 RepID=A0A7U3ZRU5_RUNSL|nr:LytTR family DNA-binding domain-containing protein [Runella slithyformis]AEI52210.1 two component transcriptional regulator, LytTR family [Runella slithyformis DSM 19594]
MKILIIEDEKLTAKDLARTIIGLNPDAEIIAMLPSVEEGVAFLQTSPQIDLIFSDIQLGDGLSFEIFEKTQNQTPVIFCTAFNEYALEAFKTVGIDYLLKPFSKATVGKALEKYQLLKERLTPPKDEMKGLMNLLKAQLQPVKTPSVIIQQGDKIIPLDTAQVALFVVENDGVFAYTFESRKWLVSQALDHLEQSLSPTFFRANRQFLVNRRAVKDASQHFNRKIAINLTVPFTEQIVVGKLKVTAFVEWLANI